VVLAHGWGRALSPFANSLNFSRNIQWECEGAQLALQVRGRLSHDCGDE